MQVSWIDPDELARLAAELNGPLPSVDPGTAWDMNTLPEISADALMPAMRLPAPPLEVVEEAPLAPPPELNHIREKLRAIRGRAQDAGLLPKKELPPTTLAVVPRPVAPPPPEPAPPVPVVSSTPTVVAAPAEPVAKTVPSARAFLNLDGPLKERLRSFMSWVSPYVPNKEVLLVDDHGELLWGNPTHPELALSAILAANASMRSAGARSLTQQPATTLKLNGEKQLTVLPCVTQLGMVTVALLNAVPTPTEEQISCVREALVLCVEGKK